MIGNHPDRDGAVGLTLGAEDPQALHAATMNALGERDSVPGCDRHNVAK